MKQTDGNIVAHDLCTMLSLLAERYGEKTALREKKEDKWQDISFLALKNDVQNLSLSLRDRFAAGERVLLYGVNCADWVKGFFALTFAGAVPVPVEEGANRATLRAFAEACGATGILYGAGKRGFCPAFARGKSIPFARFASLAEEGAEKERGAETETDPAATAAIFYTPGTTGKPKGVMLSHGALLAAVTLMSETSGIGTEDVFLSHLPLSHTYEFVCGLLFPLFRGATVAFGGGISRLLRDMREVHPSAMVTIPYIAEALYRKVWREIDAHGGAAAVRRVLSMTDPVRPLSLRQKLKERLLVPQRAVFGGSLRRLLVPGKTETAVQKGLRQLGVLTFVGYGLTECAGLAAMNREDRYLDGSAGLPFPRTLLDIYNEQPDGSGEIRYQGENMMSGYYGDEEETARVLRGGWYYTGDVGKIDANGFLHILGRKQNCIVTKGGRLVSPEELERLLMQSPLVKEAVVVGLLNEEESGYQPAALIEPDAAYLAKEYGEEWHEAAERAADEWIAEINALLHPYQQIAFYAFRHEPFAHDHAGRVIRAGLAEAFAAARAEQSEP